MNQPKGHGPAMTGGWVGYEPRTRRAQCAFYFNEQSRQKEDCLT